MFLSGTVTALNVFVFIPTAIDVVFLFVFLFRFIQSRSRFYLFLVLSLFFGVASDAMIDAGLVIFFNSDNPIQPTDSAIRTLEVLGVLAMPIALVAYYVFDMVVLAGLNVWTHSMLSVANPLPQPRKLLRLGSTVRVLRVLFSILLVLQAAAFLSLLFIPLSGIPVLVAFLLAIVYGICATWQLVVVIWVYLDIRSCSTPLQVYKRDQLLKFLLMSLFMVTVSVNLTIGNTRLSLGWFMAACWWVRCIVAAWTGAFVGLDAVPDPTPLSAAQFGPAHPYKEMA